MDWFTLTLLCAFAFASADALTKRYISDYRATEAVIVRFTTPGVLLLPLLLYLGIPDLPIEFWGWVLCLMPLEIIAMLLYVQAIRDSSLALTLPYLAFTPVFNILTGWFVLGESVSPIGIAGIFCVVAGAWLLNVPNSDFDVGHKALAPFRAILSERGSRLMLIVAFIYSFTSVLGKGALQYTTPLFFGTFYYINIGLAALLIFSLRSPGIVRVMWRRPLPQIAIGICMAVMVIAHFAAIAGIEVAYMIAVKRTSMLFGMIYGIILFKEHTTKLQFLAASIMIIGVFLIAS